MRFVTILSILTLIQLRVAHASCGSPFTALTPPSGSQLPPHATVYLFDTDHEANIRDNLVVTSAAEQRIKFRAVKLASTADYTVHRIELTFVSLRDKSIALDWKGTRLATYEIAEPGQPDEARVIDVTHHTRSWTCSFANEIEVAVDGNAIAYQIEWEDDRTTVVADEHVMWNNEAGDHSVFALGHPDCMSYNVEPELLATPRSFELYALFADGMVKRLGSSVAQLDERGGVRLPVELIRDADVRFPRRFSVAITTSPEWVIASGAVGGLAGAIVILVVGWKRRRRADQPEPERRVVQLHP